MLHRIISTLLPLACVPAVALAQTGDSGGNGFGPRATVIDSVAIVSRNVFDPEEAAESLLFRLANAFHIRTRRYVIRQELLFKVGEAYDSAKVAETARNLRALQLFRDVDIDSLRSGDTLTVRVNAADAWTTTLQADGRSSGGDLMWGLGVKEKNLLGTGTTGRIKYRKEVDRNSFTVEAAQNRLLGTRAMVYGRLDELSDGSKGVWGLGFPFRAFADRRGLMLPGEFAQRRVLQFRDGDVYREYWQRLVTQRVNLGVAPVAGEEGYFRLNLMGQLKREEYLPLVDTGLVIPDTVTGALGMTAELVRARFQVTHYYLGFSRDVDVDLSSRLTIGTWLAPEAFGYQRTGIGPTLDFQVAAAAAKSFARLEAHANGLFTSTGLDSGQVRTALTVVTQPIHRAATVFRLEAGLRDGTPPSEEFDVGFGAGLRGFPAHAFTGNRMVWGTLEQRWFLIDDFLRLFGIGLAGFVDYGGAWFDDQSARFGGEVGAGLRLASTRAGAVTMGRIDVGYRVGDGFDGRRWVLSFGRNVTF